MTDPITAQNPEGAPEDGQPGGFALWAVLRRDPAGPRESGGHGDDARALEQVEAAVAGLEAEGGAVRGFYDASGLRADADLIIWLHGPAPETLQRALRQLRRTALLQGLLPTWNAMGVHRGAEFNRSHSPAFLNGAQPRDWLAVYPFVRGYDWYLLPPQDRSRMLAEHGKRGSAYRSVLSNTVSAFALGDYEWIVPLESDNLTDLVDLMRDLRGVDARLHVREEIPFFTGRRIEPAQIAEVLR